MARAGEMPGTSPNYDRKSGDLNLPLLVGISKISSA